MKEGIPVIPGVLLLPSVATASTFTAGSGDTPSKSQDPRQIFPSLLLSSLCSHHTRARSLHAGCPGERGGRLELSSGHTTHPCAASPGSAHLYCWPRTALGVPQRAQGGAEHSSFHSTQSHGATCHTGQGGPQGGHLAVMGMRSTVDERCQHRQAAQRAWGGPSCTASSTQTEMLQPPGSPGEVRPSAPPLDSHLAEGREKHKSGQISPRANTRWQLLPTEDNTPQNAQALLFLRGGCQTFPFSPPTPPPPLRLAWEHLLAMLPHSAKGGSCLPAGKKTGESLTA